MKREGGRERVSGGGRCGHVLHAGELSARIEEGSSRRSEDGG